MITGYQGIFNPGQSVTIAINLQASSAINTGGMSLCGIFMPSAFTGSAITFQASKTLAGTYVDVYNGLGQVSYPAAASQFVAIDPKDFQGIQFLKIKSGSSEAASRTLVCTLRGI